MYKPRRIVKKENAVRLWEIAMAVGLAAAICSSLWAGATQARLAERVLRLHVVAASDSAEDQALKLKVRDRVVQMAGLLTQGIETVEDAQAVLRQRLPALEAAALDEVRRQGLDLPVRAEIDETHFPTKQYDGFALPAGDYLALRILIGEASGQNWWCVVFPSLCMPTAAPDWQETAETGGLTEEQIGLIGESDGGYVIKFQIVEWWDAVCRFFSGR